MKKNMNQNKLNLLKRLRNFCTETETKIPLIKIISVLLHQQT